MPVAKITEIKPFFTYTNCVIIKLKSFSCIFFG